MNRLISTIGVCAIIACASVPVRAADMAAAKQSYNTFCMKCHGTDGQGDGAAAATLATKPRNFTDCATMGKITDETLFNAIKNGGASVGLSKDMQAWSTGFADDEIHDLVAYVRTFCKK
ncbi:MAG: c-type cytochrome [Candidatus Binatus sp.]|uniref:c-type cytochrome n=1 Tax=Candidatus Binatus sp. TaxID=2811406 RepID=UPI003C885AC2